MSKKYPTLRIKNAPRPNLNPTRTRFLSRLLTRRVISPMAAPEDNCSAFAAVSFQLDASASCRSMAFHLQDWSNMITTSLCPSRLTWDQLVIGLQLSPLLCLFVRACFLWRHSFIFVWVGCPQLIFFWLLRTVSSHFCPYVCVCQATILTIGCLSMLFFIKSKLQCTSLSVFIYVLLIEEIQLIWRPMTCITAVVRGGSNCSKFVTGIFGPLLWP